MNTCNTVYSPAFCHNQLHKLHIRQRKSNASRVERTIKKISPNKYRQPNVEPDSILCTETINYKLSERQIKSSLYNSERLLKMCERVQIKSEASGISFMLNTCKGAELIENFEKILKSTGIKHSYLTTSITSILDNNICLTKKSNNLYEIEFPSNNYNGYNRLIRYDSNGNLQGLICVIETDNGTYEEQTITKSPYGTIFSSKNVKCINSNQNEQITINYFYDNTGETIYKPVLDNTKLTKLPNGYIFDNKTKNIIKVNPDEMTTELKKFADGGILNIKDKNGNVLGTVQYTIQEDGLHFFEFSSYVNGMEIGTKLINKLKEIANKNKLNIYATAHFEPSLGAGSLKPASNLEFYYKMGFKAINPGIDKLIQYCIANHFTIPTCLNKYVKIQYTK